MFTQLEFFIAFRYLKSRKTEGFISVVSLFSLLGIALGVAALIVVMAVMNGFRIELTNKIVSFGGDISAYSSYGYIEDYESYRNTITRLPEVKYALPLIEKQGLVMSGKNSATGAIIKGISPLDMAKEKLIIDNIIDGNIKDFDDEFVVIIGKELAYSLRVAVGDEIKIISSQINSTILGQLPKFKTFRIVGICAFGMSQYDESAVFMPLSSAQTFYQLQNKVNIIEIHTNNPQESTQTKFKIMEILGNQLDVNDWQTKNMSYFHALKTERVVMFFILALIVIVAAFNIISSLIMLVKDKTEDIAILRTIGATNGSIIRIFLICGSTLGIIGTFCGALLGVTFALNIERIKLFIEKISNVELFNPLIYFLSNLPSEIETYDVARTVVLALILSFSATIYPAWRAANIDPVKALKS